MSRITIIVDSATPQEVYDLTLAFQRTSGIPLPANLTTEPTVKVAGKCMTWQSPALHPAQVEAILTEVADLRTEREMLEVTR